MNVKRKNNKIINPSHVKASALFYNMIELDHVERMAKFFGVTPNDVESALQKSWQQGQRTLTHKNRMPSKRLRKGRFVKIVSGDHRRRLHHFLAMHGVAKITLVPKPFKSGYRQLMVLGKSMDKPSRLIYQMIHVSQTKLL